MPDFTTTHVDTELAHFWLTRPPIAQSSQDICPNGRRSYLVEGDIYLRSQHGTDVVDWNNKFKVLAGRHEGPLEACYHHYTPLPDECRWWPTSLNHAEPILNHCRTRRPLRESIPMTPRWVWVSYAETIQLRITFPSPFPCPKKATQELPPVLPTR